MSYYAPKRRMFQKWHATFMDTPEVKKQRGELYRLARAVGWCCALGRTSRVSDLLPLHDALPEFASLRGRLKMDQ
jgi:hypothetical protein